MLCHVLGALGGDGGEGVGELRLCGGAGEVGFGVGPDQAGHADGGHAEGQRKGLAQQRGGEVRLLRALQDGGHETQRIQCFTVARLGRFGARAAVEILPDESRQPPLRPPLEVHDPGIGAVQIHVRISGRESRLVQMPRGGAGAKWGVSGAFCTV